MSSCLLLFANCLRWLTFCQTVWLTFSLCTPHRFPYVVHALGIFEHETSPVPRHCKDCTTELAEMKRKKNDEKWGYHISGDDISAPPPPPPGFCTASELSTTGNVTVAHGNKTQFVQLTRLLESLPAWMPVAFREAHQKEIVLGVVHNRKLTLPLPGRRRPLGK